MPEKKKCSNCGAELAADFSGTQCPKCASASSSSSETRSIPPDKTIKIDPNKLSAKFEERLGETIGRYKLLEKIGEGGFGAVYVAEQKEPVRRRVALKVIKLGMDTAQVVARFEAERQALALMDHPNIAKVLDAGATETGRPYFVMELVRGIRITDYCDQNNLTMRERLELFAQVCRAIQHAHQKGIIHRDIKPSNILVTLHDGTPVPKVIDFGLAKATQGNLTDKTVYTEFRQFMGTPAYMSPEQADLSGLDVDTRSDIYSLGVLLYELLTGKTPFGQDELFKAGLDELRRIIREKEPTRPSTRISTLSADEQSTIARHHRCDPPKLRNLIRGDLDWIVMKCLEKDRTRRYETANGIAADIGRFLNNEPVSASPPSQIYRFQKLVRRNKAAFAAVSAVLAILVIGLGFSTWSFLKEREAHQRALIAERKAKTEAERADRHAAEEAVQRQRAVDSRLEIEQQRAEDLFATDSPSAVAHLARIVRENPTNIVTAQRLVSALTQRNFALLAIPPIQADDELWCAKFSPDGMRVLTVAATGMIWDSSTGAALAGPLKHQGPLRYGEFSRDGARVVTASFDGTVRVWDARTGDPVIGPLQHGGTVFSARFSPDGEWIVTASADYKARIWNARTGQLRLEFTQDRELRDAEFSPEGDRIVTASRNFTSQVWDARTGKALTPPMEHGGVVYFAQFSPDGERVLTASEDDTARVWDARTGQPIGAPIRHDRYVSYAEFSRDGGRILTASWDTTARVWDARTGEPITAPLKHDGVINFAQFSPDGNCVLTASEDNTARVWDAKTGQPLTQPLSHGSDVRYAQFSPDGERIVTASKDKTVRIWDLRPGGSLPVMFKHAAPVRFTMFDPSGQRVVTVDNYYTARVWNAATGQAQTTPLKHPYQPGLTFLGIKLSGSEGFVCADFSPDGQRLITTLQNYTGQFWNPQTGEALFKPLDHVGHTVTCVQFSPDGRWALTSSFDGIGRIWDANSGQLLFTPFKLNDLITSAQFSPDGQKVLMASRDSTAQLWDAQTGKPLLKEPIRHRAKINLARFSPDGRKIITASHDTTARIWDAQTGQPLTVPLQHRSIVFWAEFSPDGERVVTASSDKTARIWDAHTGLPVGKELKHDNLVFCASFSPDGQRIITASADHTARIWDAHTGYPLSEPFRHDNQVIAAKFSPDGRWAVTASLDGTARVWEVPDAPLPIPDWLPDLAEGVVDQRMNAQGISESVSSVGFLKIRQQIMASSASDYYTHWAKWFFADRRTRTISPNSLLRLPEYIENRIKENTTNSLDEAESLAFGNVDLLSRISVARKELERKQPAAPPAQ